MLSTAYVPLLGAFVVDVIREVLRLKTQYLALTVYGAILVLVGLFLPGGLAEPTGGGGLPQPSAGDPRSRGRGPACSRPRHGQQKLGR